MKQLKNFLFGFLVSFIGSLPLGYLNIVGFQIYQKTGINNTINYLLGIICVEVFVIYFTLLFAQKLSENKRLIKYIELFSIFFMLLLAYVFYSQSSNENSVQDDLSNYINYSTFAIGVLLNCFNFMQLPFWASWNLYLLNSNSISAEKSNKWYYIIGTLIGIFFGMLVIILGLNKISTNSESLSIIMFSIVIPLFFIGLALYQLVKFYIKYYKSKN